MLVCVYKDFEIHVDARGNFSAVYGEGPSDRYVSKDMESLQQRLDQYLTRRTKAKKFSLPVVLRNAEAATVTGIHLSQGTVTGLPDLAEFYPPAEWIVGALRRLQLLREERERIENRIHPYQIAARRGSRFVQGEATKYAEAIEKLEQEYAEKLAAALRDENAEGV